MEVLETILTRLASTSDCGYQQNSFAATEPTAWTALALLAHGRHAAAQACCDRLLEFQQSDGSLSVEASQDSPGWPTGLALLAWQQAQQNPIAHAKYKMASDRGLAWMLTIRGQFNERITWQGSNTPIQGWPWVDGTHTWLEPTAFNVLALKHLGLAEHQRTREATLLLVNRLLERGGCNYGNTFVFGQELRSHLEPTGLCLLALAGEEDTTGRITAAIQYLQRELSARTATASLSYGLLGLAAHSALPPDYQAWLVTAASRTLARDGGSYKLALVALALLGTNCPMITTARSIPSQTLVG